MKLIAAVTHDFGVGLNNDLLFKFKKDLAWFKEKTLNQTCIMGYNTFMSLPVTKSGEVLPGRRKIVLCASEQVYECVAKGAHEVVTEVTKDFIKKYKDAFVIGGPYCWRSLAQHIDTMYLTLIDKQVEADAYFPVDAFDFVPEKWWSHHLATETESDIELKFMKYTKK